MSKSFVRWQCEYCGTHYATKDEADACESTHSRIKGIVSAYYGNKTSKPRYVIIEFEDGSKKEYNE